MSFDQIAICALLGGMLVLFAVERLRMEVVALGGLGAGFALGLVPANRIFSGFADPAVITVVEILLIVQALARTALLDRLAGRIVSARLGERLTIAVLCLVSAALSVFMNNIGALALMLPIVYGVCRANAIAPARVLMPVSFATLLGGICSEIGTPANLIASNQLAALTGRGFSLFDFAWAGIPAALAGLAAIVLLVPRRFAAEGEGEGTGDEARMLVMAARLPPGSRLAGRPLTDLPFTLHSILRNRAHVFLATGGAKLQPGDTLLVQAPVADIASLLEDGDLAVPAGGRTALASARRAVVMPESTVVGSRVENLAAFTSRGVGIVAVSPRTARIEGAFGDLQLSIGDILYLDGPAERIADALAETEMLALDTPRPRQPPAGDFSLVVFTAGIAASALLPLPPQLAFGAVVLVLAVAGSLDLREAPGALNWPILIMLAAMIPLGGAVETTGTAQLLATSLMANLPGGSAVVPIAAMLALALLLTPFVNNASTMIVLGPVAVELARSVHIAPEPLLIAVAMGASVDFLTPFGHHNNTLVMGLGNYRFADFCKAGWPVALAASGVGLAFIVLVWAN